MNDELYHHGIRGQKWGVRNGPPYPLKGTQFHGHYHDKKRKDENYKGKKLQTLSYDPNRTKGAKFFYASSGRGDNSYYAKLFNKPIEEAGKKVRKYRILNSVSKDMKLAGEDTCVHIFNDMLKNNRDFSNFVRDPNRMRKLFVDDKYKFKSYRETRSVLEKLDKGGEINADEAGKLYRMFNYVIPSDGGGDPKAYKDLQNQVDKFFKKLTDAGYDALADTNDRYYGAFKRSTPMIIINQEALIPEDVKRTNILNVIGGFAKN